MTGIEFVTSSVVQLIKIRISLKYFVDVGSHDVYYLET